MKLRPHQKRDYKLINKEFKNHRHILFSAPTGYGKTVLLGKFVKDIRKKDQTVLIIAPRVKLINQFKRTLLQYGFKPHEISVHQGGNTKSYRSAKIHIASTSTLNARLKKDKDYIGDIDFVLVDEVHLNFKRLIMKSVQDLYWESSKWLGVSATPIDAKGYRLEGYDHTIANTQTIDLVEAGYLLDVDLYVEETPDLSNVELDATGDYKLSSLEETMNSSAITTSVYKVWSKKCLHKKTMVFCVDITHANAVAEHFRSHDIPVGVSHSKLSEKEDNAVMDDFKHNRIQVLISVNKLTIGFDEPSVEVLLTLRPTKSLSLMIQAVGRVLRQHDSMDKAIILDCAGWYNEFGHPFDRRNFNKIKPESRLLLNKLKKDEEEGQFTECFSCNHIQRTSDMIVKTEEDKKGIYITKSCVSCNFIMDESYIEKKGVKKLIKVKHKKPVKKKKMMAFLKHIAREKGYMSGWTYYKMKVYNNHPEAMSDLYRRYRNNKIVLSTVLTNIKKLEDK